MNYTQPQYGHPAEYVTAQAQASAYSSGYEPFQAQNNFLNHSTTYAGHSVSSDRYSFSGEVAPTAQPTYVAYPSYTEQTNYAAQTKSWEADPAPVYGGAKATYTTYTVGSPRGGRGGRGRGESRGRGGRGAASGGRGASSTGTWSSGGRGGERGGGRGGRGSSRGGRGGDRGGRGGARGGWNSDGGDFKRMYHKKKNEGPWTAAGKHPMMALMELKPATSFEEVSRVQCAKTKIWTITMSCTIEGRKFEGSGVTVKIAKAEAAIQALRAMNVNGAYQMLPHIPEKEMSKIEKLNQNSMTVAAIPATIPSVPAKKMKYNEQCIGPQVTVAQPDANLPTPETHPIMFVNQTYGPDIKTEFEIVNDQTRPPIFRCTMVVQGTTFIEMGASKKKARHSCAEVCLARFKKYPPPVVNVIKPKEERTKKKGEREKVSVVTGPLTFEDKLLDRCYQELSVISKDLNPRYIKMRNFAAIIVKDGAGEDLEKCESVVMATGTSCVYLENMKTDGSVVHDCTADSLARRGLKLYLYDELAKAIEGKASIFRETGTRQNKRWGLRPNISLILLKNVAPGGDGRVNKGTSEKQEMMNMNRKRKFEETAKPGEEFQFQELKPYIDGSLHVFFNRKETTIPPYQVLKGQTPHAIASPCDKIALHNICGYQGALLSHFVEPVYISTIGIKTLFNEEILKRAFYERLETVSGISGVTQIPSPFKLTKPSIMPIQGINKSQTFYTGFAFIWIKNRDFEVIRVPFGKRQTILDNFPKANPDLTEAQRKAEHNSLIAQRDASCIPSSLCKQAMFGNYRLICGRLGKVPQAQYKDAKQSAAGYQKVKKIVYDKFSDGGLGHWPVKEEDMNTFTEFIPRQ